ncbi:efflux RND transporter permease subunit [Kordiimonas sp. SCSIO 12610]|uniref:efflux RND transporter permease subunit n=1 Tax=Kordiimonas sp. SCSIO 12610 TaxID=2829597 RepID=UPI00210D15A5|nr:efflux RND transporter permease subunit [Kordiimonas sp. SCSIO 12610]UTW55649.1 efflux RND transporter permease subunit [Kordiimonas sp. SCSIO 12610]
MNPAEFSIKNRLISFIIMICALVGGWLAYESMARFEDPEFVIREARIITQYPGASPKEVAEEVTETLETALQEMQEVKELRSISSNGLSIITVEIKFEFAPDKPALQAIWTKMRNKVTDNIDNLPPGAIKPIINDDFGDVFGLYYVLTGPGYSDKELHEYAKDLRLELLRGDGVGKVNILGAQREVIYVEIGRERATRLGVSLQQVYADLAQQNAVVSSGDVVIGNQRLIITPSGNLDSVEAIKNIKVSTATDGTTLYLRDIANVERSYLDPSRQIVRYNGDPAIAIGVANVTGANVVKMGASIDQILLKTEASRPIGMELHEYYHQGKIVDVAVTDFALNVVAALVIVLVTLVIFMGPQSSLIIGIVLVVTIAATLATMQVAGIPMHRVSLGALIIALGMLVDNAIVVTEGLLVGIKAGRKKLELAKEVVGQAKWPLLGGTIVGILAFAPIGFAPGRTAEFTNHLFWVILISLFYSWVFAITTVPFLADLLFKDPIGALAPDLRVEGRGLRIYKNFMRKTLNHKSVPVGIAVIMFAAAIWGFQFMKPGFFPNSTSPQIVIDFWMPEGTDINATDTEMAKLESELGAIDGITDVQTVIGAGTLRYMLVYIPEVPNGAYGQFLLKVESLDKIEPLLKKVQSHIDSNYPIAQAEVKRFKLGPGDGSKIEAAFKGPDPVILRDLADKAKAIMAADAGATSVKDDWRQPTSIIRPLYSEARGRRLGVSREAFSNALAVNYSGRAVGIYREADTLIPIIARAPTEERLDARGLAAIQITSPTTGQIIPAIELMDGIERVWRDANLRKENRIYTIKAQADPVHGELAGKVFERVRPAIEAIELPAGYTLEWDGEYGDSTEAQSELATTIPFGLVAMVLTVVLLFNALKQPLVIWAVVPLSLIGVVAGLLVTDTPFEFLAILGLLSLSGLLIKNAIVLVDQMDLEISQGKARFDAVVDSAASRIRPVMMGSLTTVLGVIPLYFDAFFKSMAVVLMFGLTFATLLTLVLIPVLYAMVFRINSTECAPIEG